MATNQVPEESLDEYKKRADDTTRKILAVMMKAQKKVDEAEYKKRLEELKKKYDRG